MILNIQIRSQTKNLAYLQCVTRIMDRSVEEPKQHKQPSRKGKKAWRKHVDVSDVQAGLEQAREEVIKGSVF